MTIPSHVLTMWSAFCLEEGGIEDGRFYEAFGFGDSPSMADELGKLVLAGIKRATAGSVWSYESSGKGIPKPGDLSVVTDSNDTPLCIIETVQVDIVPFHAVSEEFAATEGEGDGSLDYWRKAHFEYFTRECERSGRSFSHEMLLACERFRVVHPRAARSTV
ncbi:ASCH domain-containing protein [Comamonas odontotermitis]|uniref:ASCH domain-containing protein n=1 Tax=Comamonas odontotermitis TaxID=379895 RepID=UPI001CC76E5C|nr:ASCH domain-containing protein [Comamonas odontotermitis]UBB18851.1 ASCH domain-containing protein [Comamonas odontotermitis]